MYSFMPQRQFVLTDLVSPSQGHPKLSSFHGTILRGHFEDNHFEKKGPTIIPDVLTHVTRVVYFRKLDPNAQLLPQLEGLLFGKTQELFLAHPITKPPDFDQVVGAQATDHQFTDQDLGQAMQGSLP